MTVDEAIRDAADSFAAGMFRVEIHVDMATLNDLEHTWSLIGSVEEFSQLIRLGISAEEKI